MCIWSLYAWGMWIWWRDGIFLVLWLLSSFLTENSKLPIGVTVSLNGHLSTLAAFCDILECFRKSSKKKNMSQFFKTLKLSIGGNVSVSRHWQALNWRLFLQGDTALFVVILLLLPVLISVDGKRKKNMVLILYHGFAKICAQGPHFIFLKPGPRSGKRGEKNPPLKYLKHFIFILKGLLINITLH